MTLRKEGDACLSIESSFLRNDFMEWNINPVRMMVVSDLLNCGTLDGIHFRQVINVSIII